MRKEIADALVRYNDLNKQSKAIEEELKALKPLLVNYITNENEGNPIEYEGIRATLANGCRKTIVGESVERIFHINLTEECYRVSNFNSLTVKELK